MRFSTPPTPIPLFASSTQASQNIAIIKPIPSPKTKCKTFLEVLVFKEKLKPEYPEKNLQEQGREPTANSTHTYGVDAMILTRATLVEGESCHPCATLASRKKMATAK